MSLLPTWPSALGIVLLRVCRDAVGRHERYGARACRARARGQECKEARTPADSRCVRGCHDPVAGAPLLLDIHGCRVRVGGPAAEGWFREEYSAFEVADLAATPHVDVVPVERLDDARAIRPRGLRHGLAIEGPLGSRRVLYHPSLDPTHILPWVESLLHWEDKTLAHACGVVRDGQARVFFAGPKTGKTTTLLGLVRDGDAFLGDDLVVVGNGRAYPYPKTVHLYDYNLVDDADLRARVLSRGLPWGALLRARGTAARASRHLPTRGARFMAETAFGRMIASAPIDRVVPGARVAEAAPIVKAVWLVRVDADSFRRTSLSRDDLAERVLNATFHERAAHLGRIALAAALDGRDEWTDAHFDRSRAALRAALEKADRIALEIPRSAAPRDVVREVRSLVGARV